ncbi:MAG TPA: nicotinate phosphoribosyltransferase [Bacteroidales bacterium]|jgi:nicotinate phosphoribosyltransferase|nr:nicotinate phosphoribosyltransferase [Bacteroidales bacterium]
MILKHFTDNDLYKFTTMNAIQKLYPHAMVRYAFINRGKTVFPDGFGSRLKHEIDSLADLFLSPEEEKFIISRCYYFDPVFVDLLKGFRYDPREVQVEQSGGDIKITIEGLWYRTVLWEVPILALVSELYYIMSGDKPSGVEEKAKAKATRMRGLKAEYSDFGTRRRFSFDVHDQVIGTLKEHSGNYFKGTSNVFLAMKYDIFPIGTHPHEWFMFHGAQFGYRSANEKALDAWVDVYHGYLGTALSDTYTTDNFFASFSTLHAKLFDGIRQDSGDPLLFTDRAIEFYKSKRTDPATKTIVFSDALNMDRIDKIRKHVKGRIHDVYGIGTYLSNDTGIKPLNIVIKMTGAKLKQQDQYHNCVKLSDDPGKYVGDEEEIYMCRKILGLH